MPDGNGRAIRIWLELILRRELKKDEYRSLNLSKGARKRYDFDRLSARFRISRAGWFRNILCDNCRYSAGFNGIPKQNDRPSLAEMTEAGRHADHQTLWPFGCKT